MLFLYIMTLGLQLLQAFCLVAMKVNINTCMFNMMLHVHLPNIHQMLPVILNSRQHQMSSLPLRRCCRSSICHKIQQVHQHHLQLHHRCHQCPWHGISQLLWRPLLWSYKRQVSSRGGQICQILMRFGAQMMSPLPTHPQQFSSTNHRPTWPKLQMRLKDNLVYSLQSSQMQTSWASTLRKSWRHLPWVQPTRPSRKLLEALLSRRRARQQSPRAHLRAHSRVRSSRWSRRLHQQPSPRTSRHAHIAKLAKVSWYYSRHYTCNIFTNIFIDTSWFLL